MTRRELIAMTAMEIATEELARRLKRIHVILEVADMRSMAASHIEELHDLTSLAAVTANNRTTEG